MKERKIIKYFNFIRLYSIPALLFLSIILHFASWFEEICGRHYSGYILSKKIRLRKITVNNY